MRIKEIKVVKSFSDLKQSKKLAKILPLESADMRYSPLGDNLHPWILTDTFIEKDAVPCWSLAALISVLPKSIEFKGNNYYLRFMKEYVEYANDEVSITGRCLHTIGNNNLVDAVFEMILKLNEQKIL